MEKAKPDVDEASEFKVADRRHWAQQADGQDASAEIHEPLEPEPERPSVLDEYRQRTESAERQLQDYIEAFKHFREEQDAFRERMQRDVGRRVELQFAGLIEGFLESIDHLELALRHADGVPLAQPLTDGVKMARDRFLATIEAAGVVRIDPVGETFDPNEAEAIRMDPVEAEDGDGKVTETIQPGYRLGDKVIRAARVAVGRAVRGPGC